MEQIKKIVIVLVLVVFSSNANSQISPVKVNLYNNGNKLNADFYKANSDKPLPALILLHGYPGGEGDLFGLGKKLSSVGINVLVFNFQGTWSSEGEFSFENSMDDVGAAIKFLKVERNIEKYNIDTSEIVVAGYSFGGAMVLTAALYNPEVKRIISIAGGDESVFGRKRLTDENYNNWFEQFLIESEYPDGPVKCDTKSYTKFWLSNLDKYDQVKHAESLKNRDILFLGGWKDKDVVLEEQILPLYRKLQELNNENLQIHVFETDHGFSNVREELVGTIEKWIKEMK